MGDIRRIPFSEMVERVQQELVRDASEAEATFKGRVNDAYLFDIPSQIDWRHIRKVASVTTTADYSTGYITDVSSTTVTGDADCDWTSAISNNMLLKVSGYEELFRVTYSSETALTLDRTWIGDAISSTDTSYSLFQDRYALASDFERMALEANQSVYYWQNGIRVYLEYLSPDNFEDMQTYQHSTPSYYTIKWVNDDPYLFIDPPDTSARTIEYVYIPTLARMTEYTTSTVKTLANAGTAVVLNAGDVDGYLADFTTYSYYFRIDGDGTGSASVWYKVASATDDTNFTLSDAYGGTAITSGTSAYTLSKVSLLPSGLDLAIMYQAAIVSSTDQDNPNQAKMWMAMYQKILTQYRGVESKKGYGTQRVQTIYADPGVRR